MSKKHNYRVVTSEQIKPRNYVHFDNLTLEQACAFASALTLGIVKETFFGFAKVEEDFNLVLQGYGILRETRMR